MMLILLILSLAAFATAEVNFLLAFLKVIIVIISRLRTPTPCSRLTYCSSVQCRPWMVCSSLDLSRLFTTIAFIIVFHCYHCKSGMLSAQVKVGINIRKIHDFLIDEEFLTLEVLHQHPHIVTNVLKSITIIMFADWDRDDVDRRARAQKNGLRREPIGIHSVAIW